MDLLANVSAFFLAGITAEPGGCFTVTPKEMEALLADVIKRTEIKRHVTWWQCVITRAAMLFANA